MIRLLSDNLLLKEIKREDEVVGGIYLPDFARIQLGKSYEVIAIGPGKIIDSGALVPMVIEVGNEVVIPDDIGTEFVYDGTQYVIASASDVKAVI